jgi:coenzyme Q-binding protein COQ10
LPSARHTTEINASPEQVLSVIADFDSYKDFLPEIEDCELVREDSGTWDVRFTLKLVKRFRYVLRLEQTSPLQIRWHLLEGVFKANDGGWDLESLDDGKRTRATYFIDLQVGMFVPSSIMRNAVNRSLPDTVRRFRDETQRRFPTS